MEDGPWDKKSKDGPWDKKSKEAEKTTKSYIRHLWDGDASLGFSYWVLYILIGGLFSVTATAWGRLTPNSIFFVIGMFNIMLCTFVWYAFAMVCTWRSASKYQGPKFWAILAKIMIVFGFLQLVYVLFALIFFVVAVMS